MEDRSGGTTPAAGRKPKQRRKRWSAEEHTRFLDALKMFGRDWRKIEEHVGTRTTIQLRSHAQKYFEKAQKLGVTGLPPPRPRRRRKGVVPPQPQSSSPAGQRQPHLVDVHGTIGASGTSASGWASHGGPETQAEPAAATYPGDNSFMGTPSFFTDMSTGMPWVGTGSTSAAPSSSLPTFMSMLTGGDQAALEPWEIIMQEIKDIGLALDLDMTVFPSFIQAAAASQCAGPPPYHGFTGASDQAETSLNRDGGSSADVKVGG